MQTIDIEQPIPKSVFEDAVCEYHRQLGGFSSKQVAQRPNYNLRLKLPLFIGEAFGANKTAATIIQDAWLLLFKAVCVFDHYIDGDVVIEKNLLKESDRKDLNLASGLLIGCSQKLLELYTTEVPHKIIVKIQQEFFASAQQILTGQHADISIKSGMLDDVWKIVDLKSGEFFSLSVKASAMLSVFDEQILSNLKELGRYIGMLQQVTDDFWDIWGVDGEKSDIAVGNLTSIPVAFALSVLNQSSADQLRFLLNKTKLNKFEEAQARTILFDSGAALYLKLMSLTYAELAKSIISELPISIHYSSKLIEFIDDLILILPE